MLVLGQIPHHGSIGNHNNAFWRIRKRVDKTAMVVSAGQNSYNHPSIQVLDFFKKNNFIIYSTFEDSKINNKIINEIRDTLDIYSYTEPKENSFLNGDQKFQFKVKELGYKYLPNKGVI